MRYDVLKNTAYVAQDATHTVQDREVKGFTKLRHKIHDNCLVTFKFVCVFTVCLIIVQTEG